MVNENLGWDDAISSGKYIKFPEGEQKVLTITNFRLERNPEDAKVGAGEISLKADVIEEDGEPCEKVLEVNSNRLKKKLRPILENKKQHDEITIVVTKVGDKFDTQYSVKEVTVAPKKKDMLSELKNTDEQIKRLMDQKEKGQLTQEGFDIAMQQLKNVNN